MKKIVTLALTLTAAVLLASCAPQKPKKNSATTSTTVETTAIQTPKKINDSVRYDLFKANGKLTKVMSPELGSYGKNATVSVQSLNWLVIDSKSKETKSALQKFFGEKELHAPYHVLQVNWSLENKLKRTFTAEDFKMIQLKYNKKGLVLANPSAFKDIPQGKSADFVSFGLLVTGAPKQRNDLTITHIESKDKKNPDLSESTFSFND